MIICKECGNETAVAIKREFLCMKCYDKRMKAKPSMSTNSYAPPKIGKR